MVSFSEHYLWLGRRGDLNSYPPAKFHDHINSGDGYKHRGVYSVKFTPAEGRPNRGIKVDSFDA